MRQARRKGNWVFLAATASGHFEKSTLKKQHPKAYALAKLEAFPLYTFRHTCSTRWAEYMDPYCSRRDGPRTKGRGWAQKWAHCASTARRWIASI